MMRIKRPGGMCNAISLAPALLLPLVALGACNDGNAAHGAPGAPDSATASYVLVTQRRPEAPEKFLARQRAVYDICAAVASERHIVAKPFPALPRDFVDGRTTYASDGKRVVVREVLYTLDFGKGQAADACDMRLSSQTDVSVISDGQQQSAHIDEDGAVQRDEPQPSFNEAVRAGSVAQFTLATTINGIRLRCRTDELCIVDPAVVMVAQGMNPVLVASRIDDVATYGTALVLEPVSLSVGKPVDPGLFALGQ